MEWYASGLILEKYCVMKQNQNIAIIFAGGSGRRMNAGAVPKQFLELHGKPIIIYTLELFERHPQIDAIYVACISEWIDRLRVLLSHYGLHKVRAIVPGGDTGQDSIYQALLAAENDDITDENTLALIHDGVRPLILPETITDNIAAGRQHGSCITCIPASETLVVRQEEGGFKIPSRKDSLIARAPQTFFLEDILSAHRHAIYEGRHDFIDSLTLMTHYGYSIHTMMGPIENIKITTPMDYYLFKALVDVRENTLIFGL